MKKKRSKSPIFLEKCWEIIPRTRVRFDFPRFHQKRQVMTATGYDLLFLSNPQAWYVIMRRSAAFFGAILYNT